MFAKLSSLPVLENAGEKKLLIEFCPYGGVDGQAEYADVRMTIQNPDVKQQGVLAFLWKEVATIPCSRLSEEGVSAWDEQGALCLDCREEPAALGLSGYVWHPMRDTVGCVHLRYRIYPRVVPKDYRFHPYYDFRNEPNGASMAGNTTLLAIGDSIDTKYQIHFRWDFSHMPEGTWGACVRGEGSVDYVGSVYDYQFTMYQFGRLKAARFYGGQVRVYWLSDNLPDRERILDGLPKVYKAMAEFFRDPDRPYVLFIRKDPFRMSNGATAFQNGFIYGFSDEKPLNLDMALDIFAHEIVHTWPRLEDKAGEGTWYHEGTAELYSILVPYRAGITDIQFAAKQISLRELNYYNNPFRTMPNRQAYPLYWTQRKAQWLPYGRGFFYLVDTDCRLRKASGGRITVDDLVLELEDLRRERTITVADWEALILRELGETEVERFRAVMNGALIEPSEEWFGGAFAITRGRLEDPVRGTVDENAYIWQPKRASASL